MMKDSSRTAQVHKRYLQANVGCMGPGGGMVMYGYGIVAVAKGQPCTCSSAKPSHSFRIDVSNCRAGGYLGAGSTSYR